MPKRSVNKSAFVRQMGSLPAKEIVNRAKQRGIDLSIAHVYTIRSAANRRGRPKVAPTPHAPSMPQKRANKLSTRIDAMTSEFVEAILRALRSASLEDLVRR
jgi:hypothetical protein